MLLLKPVAISAQRMGLSVWPDFHTAWHFDDKLSQKYLFEALELPAVQAWAFYTKKDGLAFAESCELPIVGKQTRGAGSVNVHLFKTRSQVKRYVNRMFGKGYPALPAPWKDMGTKLGASARSAGASGIFAKLKKAPGYLKKVLKPLAIWW
jgi:hypothetical protein